MTLTQAQAQLDAWLAASLALAGGKEHMIGDRRIRLEDGGEVRKMIAHWRAEVARLEARAAGRSVGSARYAVADFSECR